MTVSMSTTPARRKARFTPYELAVFTVVAALLLLALVGPLGGEDEHRHVGPLADAAEDVEAVDVGEAEVEHDRARVLGGAPVEGVLAGGGRDHLVAAGLEGDGEGAQDRRLVVDDEDALSHGAPGA